MNKLKKLSILFLILIILCVVSICYKTIKIYNNQEIKTDNDCDVKIIEGVNINSSETEISKTDKIKIENKLIFNKNQSYNIDTNYLVNIKEEKIEVTGLKNEYNFLFLTDTHIALKDEGDSDEIKKFQNNSPDSINKNGIKSEDAFPYWIEYSNNMKIDAFLMGGDMISYPTEKNISFLSDELKNLNIPYIYAVGNHDWSFPWAYLSDYNYLDMLSEFTTHNIIEYEDLIILALDSSTNQITEESLELFKAYYDVGKSVIIVMHVPISTESVFEKSVIDWNGNIAIGKEGIYPNNITNEFLSLLYAEESPVVCILGGHLHFYDRSTLINDKTIQIISDEGYGGNAILLQINNNNK